MRPCLPPCGWTGSSTAAPRPLRQARCSACWQPGRPQRQRRPHTGAAAMQPPRVAAPQPPLEPQPAALACTGAAAAVSAAGRARERRRLAASCASFSARPRRQRRRTAQLLTSDSYKDWSACRWKGAGREGRTQRSCAARVQAAGCWSPRGAKSMSANTSLASKHKGFQGGGCKSSGGCSAPLTQRAALSQQSTPASSQPSQPSPPSTLALLQLALRLAALCAVGLHGHQVAAGPAVPAVAAAGCRRLRRGCAAACRTHIFCRDDLWAPAQRDVQTGDEGGL